MRLKGLSAGLRPKNPLYLPQRKNGVAFAGAVKIGMRACSCMIVPVNHGIIACEEAKGIVVSDINYGRV